MRIGLLCGVAVLGLSACTQAPSPGTDPGATTTVTSSATPEAPASAQQPPSNSSKPVVNTTGTTRVSTPPPAPAATVTLSVVKQPTCPVHGTPDAPFSAPGTDVTISWKVTGATGAALAVDNPNTYGAYGMYAATGQLSLSFPCGTTPGKTTHTYTVWPAGIKNVSKSISVSANNNA